MSWAPIDPRSLKVPRKGARGIGGVGFATLPDGPVTPCPRPKAKEIEPKRYAVKTEIVTAVAAIQESGLPIVTIDLHPDGTIRLSSVLGTDPAKESEFDRWDKAGRL